jgi:SAM-dependent methyltransferase
MEWFVKSFMRVGEQAEVLDVGSYNVNGCYREMFESRGFTYKGLDMEPGPNVDIVATRPYQWDEIADDIFDAVISGQALEHIEFFWVTVAEMVRVTKEGGLICIIAPNGFEEHRYPVDCWRFFTDGMIAIARYYQLEILNAHTNAAPTAQDIDWYSSDCADSMLVARKKYSGSARIVDLNKYECIPGDQQAVGGGLVPYRVALAETRSHEADMPEKLKESRVKENENKSQVSTESKGLGELMEKMRKKLVKSFGKRAE